MPHPPRDPAPESLLHGQVPGPPADGAGQGSATSGLRAWWIALLVVLTANSLFLGLNVAGLALPTGPVAERVRTAFETGELGDRDWRPFDGRRGLNQYNDCLILLMGLNRETGPLARAVGPVLTYRDDSYTGYCMTLEEVVRGDQVVATYWTAPYTRYWHGYVPLTIGMLQVLEVHQFRLALKLGLYASLVLLVIGAATRGRELLPVAGCIAAAAATVWAVRYYGQSPSHAPGDTLVMLGLACLLLFRDRLARPGWLVPFCAAYGAGVVYLEFLTGQLPTAAGLLFPLAYLVTVTRPGHEVRPDLGWRNAMLGLVAFGFGAGLTIVLKQVLVLFVVGPDGLASFVNNFRLWTGQPREEVGPGSGVWRLLTPLEAVLRAGEWLTYRSVWAAKTLYGMTAACWLAAGWMAFRGRSPRSRSDYLAFVAGVSVLPLWILVFANHTLVHSVWTVRMLIVPISLGWAALVWQWTLSRGGGITPGGQPPTNPLPR